MADQYLHEVIEDKLEEVRRFLVMARVLRQEGEAHAEMDALYGPGYQDYGKAEVCLEDARVIRLSAKALLEEIEIANGKLYLEGWKPILLRKHLNGRNFRTWRVYEGAYALSPLFKGLDPS